MNSDDEYQAWLSTRRAEPPRELTDRIMTAVSESRSRTTVAVARASGVKSSLRRIAPYLVCSAAALVLAVRLYSVVSLFVIAPSGTEIVMNELVEEPSDVNKP